MLRTNRSGAYSCSTIVDCNTRKYHGLLVVPVPELDDENHVLRVLSNALQIAQWLKQQPEVTDVYYAGLPEHPGFQLNRQQASGSGAMISFKVRDSDLARSILGKVKLIAFAESLGGVESLITYPLYQTHECMPKYLLERTGLDDRLLRLSVGIEATEDLIADLQQAFR